MLRKGQKPSESNGDEKSGPPSFKAPGALSAWPGESKESLPTWSRVGDSKLGGLPLLRGKGLGGQGSLLERLKGLKKRDLIFIGSGLAVLLMAPLAEYMMTSPEKEAGSLQSGFDRKGPVFPDSGSPYEEGVSGIAPGGLLGQETDVITPLNVRDPSALVMGPGQAEKPAAPPAAPPKKPETTAEDWKEAVKEGAKKAAEKAPGLPKPPPKLAGALQDWAGRLSGLKGGGGPSFTLTPPTSAGLLSRPQARSALTPTQSRPGLQGGARVLAGGPGGAGSPFGRPFGPGGGFTDQFSPGGPGAGGSGRSGGRPHDGDSTKFPGGSSTKDSRSTSLGENLALLAAKLNLERAIALKWDKRRYDELERKKMLEQIAANTASQALLKILDKLLEKPKDAGGGDKGKGGGDKSKNGKGTKGTPPGTGQPDPTDATRTVPTDAGRPPTTRPGPGEPTSTSSTCTSDKGICGDAKKIKETGEELGRYKTGPSPAALTALQGKKTQMETIAGTAYNPESLRNDLRAAIEDMVPGKNEFSKPADPMDKSGVEKIYTDALEAAKGKPEMFKVLEKAKTEVLRELEAVKTSILDARNKGQAAALQGETAGGKFGLGVTQADTAEKKGKEAANALKKAIDDIQSKPDADIASALQLSQRAFIEANEAKKVLATADEELKGLEREMQRFEAAQVLARDRLAVLQRRIQAMNTDTFDKQVRGALEPLHKGSSTELNTLHSVYKTKLEPGKVKLLNTSQGLKRIMDGGT